MPAREGCAIGAGEMGKVEHNVEVAEHELIEKAIE